MTSETTSRADLKRFAWLSIAAALLTIALKALAYALTGSVGLLSDALESLVNLAGAIMALAMLTIAARPADADHTYGHGKAEYFSSLFEGILILVAAASIGLAAVQRLLAPRPLDQLGLGLGISAAAALINLVVARVLLRAGLRHRSITLEADAHHLMTDVWTSAGVLAGVGAVAFTGWQRLDSIVALLVAGNIVWTGIRIVRDSVSGLMDAALPAADQAQIQQVLKPYLQDGAQCHAFLTRQSGARRFVTFHLLVPGAWTVQRGHQLVEQIEADLRQSLPGLAVLIHLESLDDPASWEDAKRDSADPSSPKPRTSGMFLVNGKAKDMNSNLRNRAGMFLLLLGSLWLAGCGGGGGGSGQDYSGTWQGRTSHGGSVAFTVVDNAVTVLAIIDDQASVRVKHPVEIAGNSFSADNSETAPVTGSPLVSAQCTFDSATHGSGSYSVAQAPDKWTGTFEVSRP